MECKIKYCYCYFANQLGSSPAAVGFAPGRVMRGREKGGGTGLGGLRRDGLQCGCRALAINGCFFARVSRRMCFLAPKSKRKKNRFLTPAVVSWGAIVSRFPRKPTSRYRVSHRISRGISCFFITFFLKLWSFFKTF